MQLEPRPYQQECLDIINKQKPGSYLVSMATGLGKTVVMSMIERKGRTLILSHRDELVKQPLKYFDCSKGIEKAEYHSNGEDVVSASVQSLSRRLDSFEPNDFDLIITDEAHHAAAKSYKKIYNYFKPRLHIGFTATPNRFDKVRLDDIYSKIIFNRDLKWGIRNGYLCDIDCYRVNIGCDLTSVERNRDDFVEYKLSDTMDQPEINEEIAETYQTMAKGQTLIFATSIAHATHIAELIPGAVVISSKTKKEDREKTIKLFEEKKIHCLVNCAIFTEGTDLPMIETILIARPTMNQSLYQQMVGRGLRLYPGKENLRLIDCVGISGRLKICTAPSLFGLDASQVPTRKQNQLVGPITEMESVLFNLIDTPKSWILQAKKIDLFSNDGEYDTHDVNWMYHPDGSLTCYLGSKIQMVISPVDELGLVTVYFQNQISGEIIGGANKKFPPQEALDTAFDYLVTKQGKLQKLWDSNMADKWGKHPITESQKEYIKKLKWLLKTNGKDIDFEDIRIKNLNKREAGIIIDRLQEKLTEAQERFQRG